MTRRTPLALAAALALLPLGAAAHEVLHAVEQGGATAVKVYLADGEPLAYAEYEIYSPADGRIPTQKGRTDRSGYLAFVPHAPGRWRVKVVDGTGHGLETAVDVAGQGPLRGSAGSAPSSTAFVLRPLVGAAVVGSLFALLFLLQRRKGAPG